MAYGGGVQQVLSHFELHARNVGLPGDVVVGEQPRRTSHIDTPDRIYDVFVEYAERQQFRRAGIPIPFQIDVVVVGRFQVGITFARKADVHILIGGDLFRLRQCVAPARSQSNGVAFGYVVADIEARQPVEFVDVLGPGGVRIHVVVHLHVHLVALQSDAHGEAVGELMGRFRIERVYRLGHVVGVVAPFGHRKPSRREVLGVVHSVEPQIVGREESRSPAEVIFHRPKAVVGKTSAITESDVRSLDVETLLQLVPQRSLHVEVAVVEPREEPPLAVTARERETPVVQHVEHIFAPVGLLPANGVVGRAEIELKPVGEVEPRAQLVGHQQVVVALLAAQKRLSILRPLVPLGQIAQKLADILVARVNEHKIVCEVVFPVELQVEVGQHELVDAYGRFVARLVLFDILAVGSSPPHGLTGIRIVGVV